jgi:hypothetical protein
VTFTLTYPALGRGAWPASGLGGTLNVAGTRPGNYYRAPTIAGVKMPGLTGALAVWHGTSCDINDYAVHRAVLGLQPYFGAVPDGILGPATSLAIRAYQKAHGLAMDAAIGPATCRTLFEQIAVDASERMDAAHANMLCGIVVGTISIESGFDLGAVGVDTPQDLGIAQINGPAHPSMAAASRLDPAIAIPWMTWFIDGNLREFRYDIDAAIAAYNLGVAGAWAWVRAGSPQWFRGRDVRAYVAKIKKAGQPQ